MSHNGSALKTRNTQMEVRLDNATLRRKLKAASTRVVSARIEILTLKQELSRTRHMAALWKQAAKGWRQAALEYLGSFEPVRVPLVGELSKDTRPEDFTQYAARSTE